MSTSLKPDSKLIVRLDFEGCVTSENIDAVPQQGGVYAAFVCNKLVDRDGFYRCSRIAYIGKAEGTDNLRKRIRQHLNEDQESWAKTCQLAPDETFVYVYAVFEDSRLADVESALINHNQPIVNTQHKDRYNGASWLLWINCKGNIGLLSPTVVVARHVGS